MGIATLVAHTAAPAGSRPRSPSLGTLTTPAATTDCRPPTPQPGFPRLGAPSDTVKIHHSVCSGVVHWSRSTSNSSRVRPLPRSPSSMSTLVWGRYSQGPHRVRPTEMKGYRPMGRRSGSDSAQLSTLWCRGSHAGTHPWATRRWRSCADASRVDRRTMTAGIRGTPTVREAAAVARNLGVGSDTAPRHARSKWGHQPSRWPAWRQRGARRVARQT